MRIPWRPPSWNEKRDGRLRCSSIAALAIAVFAFMAAWPAFSSPAAAATWQATGHFGDGTPYYQTITSSVSAANVGVNQPFSFFMRWTSVFDGFASSDCHPPPNQPGSSFAIDRVQVDPGVEIAAQGTRTTQTEYFYHSCDPVTQIIAYTLVESGTMRGQVTGGIPTPGCYHLSQRNFAPPYDSSSGELAAVSVGDAGGANCLTDNSLPACSDSQDNDGDGKTDFPDDPTCSSPLGTSEAGPPPPPPPPPPCPSAGVTTPVTLAPVDVPVKSDLKPWSLTYGPLPLTFTSLGSSPTSTCTVVSNRGRLPVNATIPGIGMHNVATSSTSATVEFLNFNILSGVPRCQFSATDVLGASTESECFLNELPSNPTQTQHIARWSSPGFDIDVPGPVRLHTGPKRYYVNLDALGASGASAFEQELNAVETFVHLTLISRLPGVTRWALFQDPPADLLVTNPRGQRTGRTAAGVVARIPRSRYLAGGGNKAVLIADPSAARYLVRLSGAGLQPFALSVSVVDVTGKLLTPVTHSASLHGTIAPSGHSGLCFNIPRAKSCFPVFSKHPIIYRVSFRGGPTSPEIIVYGKDFGRRPAPDPAGGTSNLGQCGPIPGRTGHDYGSKLWLGNRTQLWSAGYTPYGDCIGLRVTKYTDREIVYRLGSFYALHYEQRDGLGHGDYELEQGDSVDINVNGAVLTTRVRYRG